MRQIRTSIAFCFISLVSAWVIPPRGDVSRPRLSLMASPLQSEPTSPRGSFVDALIRSIETTSFIKVTLSANSAQKKEDAVFHTYKGGPLQKLKNVYGRVVVIGSGKVQLQLLLRYEHRDVTRNVPLSDLHAVEQALTSFLEPGAFRQGRLFTTNGDVELKLKPDGVNGRVVSLKPSIGLKPTSSTADSPPPRKLSSSSLPTAATPTRGAGASGGASSEEWGLLAETHDRAKAVPVAVNAPFLQHLGVTHADGKPRAGMSAKLRQIQKFVEIMDRVVNNVAVEDRASSENVLQGVVDTHSSSSSTSTVTTPGEEEDSGGGRSSSSSRRGGGSKLKLKLVDVGCGRGYLTFAAHHHFSAREIWSSSEEEGASPSLRRRFSSVETVGVEQRGDLVKEVNGIATSLGAPFASASASASSPSSSSSSSSSSSVASCSDSSGEGEEGHDSLCFVKSTIEDFLLDKNLGQNQNQNPSASCCSSSGCSGIDDNKEEDTQEQEEEAVLVLVALHACDTATDDALWAGIRNQAHAIVTAPCCHKEVRKQLETLFRAGLPFESESKAPSSSLAPSSSIMDAPHEKSPEQPSESQSRGPSLSLHPLADVLRFPTFRERSAEMATDAIRALLLEIAGYDVQCFEFIGGEHTAKNVMVVATRRPKHKARSTSEVDQLRARLASLRNLYGVKHQRLAAWMGEEEIEAGGGDNSGGNSGSTRTKTVSKPPRKQTRRVLPPL